MSAASETRPAKDRRFSLEGVIEEGREIGFRRGRAAGLLAGKIVLARSALRAISSRRFGFREVFNMILDQDQLAFPLEDRGSPRMTIRACGPDSFLDMAFDGGIEDGYREGWEKGHEEGIILEAKVLIRRILAKRFGAEADRGTARSERLDDARCLESLVVEAAAATTIEEFLQRIPAATP